MTVSTTNSITQAFPNGVTTVYPVNYRFFDKADLKVFWQKPDGTIRVLVLDSEYTVQGAGGEAGGSITTIGTPLPNGTLTIARVMTANQLTSFRNQGEFFPEIHEDAFDKLVMLVQQTIDSQGRGLTVPVSDPVDLDLELPGAGVRSNKVLAFDALGNPVQSNLTLVQIEQQPALALDSANQAAVSALSASSSANASAQSANASSASAALAQKWAENAEDDPVIAGLYSAHHWASKAALSVQSLQRQLMQFNASVASNSLFFSLLKSSVSFRSPTLSSGLVNTRDVPATIFLTVPAGATLGTIAGVQSRLVAIAIDNLGTVELAVVNQAGGINLDETSLINTTAISASANTAGTVYSTTARAGVPFRVIGFSELTQAVAGTWATSPSKVQGAGGTAMSSLTGLGSGQTWQNMIGSRVLGTTYTNTTGRPIQVNVALQQGGTGSPTLIVNGVTVDQSLTNGTANGKVSAIVPPGATYSVPTGVWSLTLWAELR